MGSLPSTSWESFPAVLKLGRTPNDAQRALYRALIWRNNLGVSTSAEGSDSEDVPEGEGLVRGNWAIASSKILMLWIARLVQTKGSAHRWDRRYMSIRTLLIFRWIRRSFSRSRRTPRRIRVLQTSRSPSRDRARDLQSGRGFGRGRNRLHTLHRRIWNAASEVSKVSSSNRIRLFQVDQRLDIDIHRKTRLEDVLEDSIKLEISDRRFGSRLI